MRASLLISAHWPVDVNLSMVFDMLLDACDKIMTTQQLPLPVVSPSVVALTECAIAIEVSKNERYHKLWRQGVRPREPGGLSRPNAIYCQIFTHLFTTDRHTVGVTIDRNGYIWRNLISETIN